MLLGLPVLVLIVVAGMASSSLMRDQITLGINEFAQRDVDVMSSIGRRAYNYRIVPKLISESSIVGHGTGAYHGVVGMLLYATLLVSLYRLAKFSDQVQGKLLLVSLTSILLMDSMINTPLFSSRESHFFLYMMALLISLNRPSLDCSHDRFSRPV